MALNQLSPGVNVKEIDLTNFVPQVGTSGGAFVGKFAWGPVEDYTLVSNSNRLESLFGKPDDSNFADWYAVSSFLAYTDNCTVVRVTHNNAGTETAFNAVAADANTGTITVKNDASFAATYGSNTYDGMNFIGRYPGKIANSLKVIIADGATWSQLTAAHKKLFEFAPGTSESAAAIGASNDEVHVIVIDDKGLFTGVPGTILEKYAFLSKASDAKGLDNAPIFFGNVINQKSQYIRYTGSDFAESVLDVGSFHVASASVSGGTRYITGQAVTFSAPTSSGVTATGTVVASPLTVTSVPVTDGGTLVTAATITFSAPGTGGTLATGTVTIVGQVVTAIVITNPGSYPNAVPTYTLNATFAGGTTPVLGTLVYGGGVPSAVTLTNPGAGYETADTITATVAATTGSGATVTVVKSSAVTTEWDVPLINPSTSAVSSYTNLLALYEQVFTGGNDGGDLDEGDLITGWDMFANSEESDVTLLFVGAAGGEAASVGFPGESISKTVINHVITNIADVRKDCMVFFSPERSDVVDQIQETATENVIAFNNAIGTKSSYAVMDSGWKLLYDVYSDKYRWVPLNADIAGLCAATDTDYDAWWSPAGFTRGRVKGAVALAYNPSKAQRDSLYSANVNPVVSFRGEGVILYGDKTQQVKSSAFQYINVRRLFIILEKAIARAAQYQLFEFNDQFTRAQFRNMVEPYLREVQGRRGLYDFKVVCDDTNNTPEIIDRAEFVASIFLKPARSINYITLNFVAVRTGVEFSEIAGV